MAPLARDLGISRVYAVANKIRSERDEAAVRDYCAKHDLEVIAYIPFDDAVGEADRAGIAVIDHDAHTPAMEQIRLLTHRLVQPA
jgi:CO dehydrogenase nickel-insertion accessory protein CooC1